jgi:hypothetical protein
LCRRPGRVDGQGAAARYGLTGNHQHVEQELDLVLGEQDAGHVPGQLGLVVLEKSARYHLGIAQIDLGSGDPAAPKQSGRIAAGRTRFDAFLDQIERKVLVSSSLPSSITSSPLTIAPLADEVVADARSTKRRQIESFEIGWI